jgi:hypothetical protein
MDKPGFGSDENGFNQYTKQYKENPSIENYVSLRRANSDAEIEVAVIGGFESMFYMREELERYGINSDLLGGILDADLDAISEISLHLMEKIIEARRLEKEGETHLIRRGLGVPDRLVDWIICCSLDALSWNDELIIPRDLIVLIRERLGGPKPQYEQEGEMRHNKGNAAIVAGQIMARGMTPTFKAVGDILGVAPSTVMRWFEPGEFERKRDMWAKRFDKDGKPLPPDQLRK